MLNYVDNKFSKDQKNDTVGIKSKLYKKNIKLYSKGIQV